MKRCLDCWGILWPWSQNFKDIDPLFDRLCALCVIDYQLNIIQTNMDCTKRLTDEILRKVRELWEVKE